MTDPDDQTRIIRRSSGGPRPSPEIPPPPGHGAAGAGQSGEDTIYTPGAGAGLAVPEGGTRIIKREGFRGPDAPSAPDPHTVLVRRPSSKPATSADPSAPGQAAASDDPAICDNPVVGWLVVIGGPGRGRSLALGYGQNPIGREPGNRVVLDFGDQEISRHKHAVLTYDPRGKKFYIQHGESTNLTYLEEEPVLAPAILNGGESIRLGDKTVLKFVPFCGNEFDWND